jgi:2-dehydropantoate 2-reductase
MKILVYGAGPLGSLFAARLQAGGNDVSLLARGQRTIDLREHGIVLVNTETGEQSVTRVNVVERLEPEDAYDLVLVIMRKNRALEVLPALAANRQTPNVLFLMNNAAGPAALVAALGQQRVIMGFPMAAGYRRDHVVHYLAGGSEDKPVLIPIGQPDGQITPRLRAVGAVLATMPGFAAELRTDMDAWLKTHVALLMPSIAPALAAACHDNVRLANTRDLIVLAIRAIREGFRVLRALGFPIVPEKLRMYAWLPEPILVAMLQRLMAHPRMRTALAMHASSAHDEVVHLANEFRALADQTSVATPATNRLSAYFDPATPPMAECSASIPLDWRSLAAAAAGLAGVAAGAWFLTRRR